MIFQYNNMTTLPKRFITVIPYCVYRKRSEPKLLYQVQDNCQNEIKVALLLFFIASSQAASTYGEFDQRVIICEVFNFNLYHFG